VSNFNSRHQRKKVLDIFFLSCRQQQQKEFSKSLSLISVSFTNLSAEDIKLFYCVSLQWRNKLVRLSYLDTLR